MFMDNWKLYNEDTLASGGWRNACWYVIPANKILIVSKIHLGAFSDNQLFYWRVRRVPNVLISGQATQEVQSDMIKTSDESFVAGESFSLQIYQTTGAILFYAYARGLLLDV